MTPTSTQTQIAPGLAFTKMQALGNDFILLEDFALEAGSFRVPVFTQLLCDRRKGIGADQVLWFLPPHASAHALPETPAPRADARLQIFNADGSEAEMCGNGVRAAAQYFLQTKLPSLASSASQSPLVVVFETAAGLITAEVLGDSVQVTLGVARFGPPSAADASLPQAETLSVPDPTSPLLTFYRVNVGNPHAVFWVDELDLPWIAKVSPYIEHHPLFPQRTNVVWVQKPPSPWHDSTPARVETLSVIVWERGAGLTPACGTGACAAAVVSLGLKALLLPHPTPPASSVIKVQLPGGTLTIEWAGGRQHPIRMTGGAHSVFSGRLSEAFLALSLAPGTQPR